MEDIKKLKQIYEKACNDYVAIFIEKQEMDFDFWVGQEVGGIASCGDFFFNFSDIAYDINTNQPKGLIIDWYYDNLGNQDKMINYCSYTKGLRISDIKQKDDIFNFE